MGKEMQNVIDMLPDGVLSELKKATKPKLIERFAVIALKTQVQQETIAEMERDLVNALRQHKSDIRHHKEEIEKLGLKLAKAETYVEQGRSMILSVMERWYEYDA